MSTHIAPSPAFVRRFNALATEWRSATRFLSAPSAAVAHPAYRAVVALGSDAVPLILAELAEGPEPWFAALRELTGADPVPPTDCGRPSEAAAYWLATPGGVEGAVWFGGGLPPSARRRECVMARRTALIAHRLD